MSASHDRLAPRKRGEADARSAAGEGATLKLRCPSPMDLLEVTNGKKSCLWKIAARQCLRKMPQGEKLQMNTKLDGWWEDSMRTILLGMTLLLTLGCATAPERPPSKGKSVAHQLPIPQDLREQIRRSCEIGRQLYVLDKVAAIGTDVLLENVKDLQGRGIGGYIPVQEGDEDGRPRQSFLVVFFTAEMPPRIAYEIHVAPDVKPIFRAFDPPKAATPSFAAFIRARKTAISAMPPTRQPINPVLVPGEANGEQGVLVYLLAGTKKPNTAVFGRHFRALVPINGTAVTYMMPLSNTALEMPTRGPNGEAPEALMVSQVVTDFPLETHVFTSLLIKKQVYVATSRGVWRVDGDQIAFISDKPPKEPE